MNDIWIKTIELTNFQKHSHLILNLVNGVNIIHGDSYAGKSCVVRAIKWLFFNEPKGDIVRKEETKKTSVKITFENNGKEITIERIKSNSINSYVIHNGDNKETYDSVGKTIPDDIKKLLGVSKLNIGDDSIILNVANQITLPFLFDKSGTFRMKLFNKLTGASIIDKVFQSLNKDILQLNRKEKSENEHLKETKENLEKTKIERDKKQELHDKFSEKYNNLKEVLEKYKRLTTYIKELENINKELLDTEEKLKNIKLIDEETLANLRYLTDKIEKLQILATDYEQVKNNLEIVNNNLNNIKINNINTTDLKEKADKLEHIQYINQTLFDINKNILKTETDITNYSESIAQNERLYVELLEKCGMCPMCKRDYRKSK